MTSKIKDLPFIPATASVAIVKSIEPSGTAATASGGKVWTTIPLNTVEGDTDLISLSSNQMTIKAGTYVITTICHPTTTFIGATRIADSTGTTSLIAGGSNISTGDSAGEFYINTVYTFTEETTITYQWFSSGTSGIPSSFGVDEVFAILTFIKI